MKNIFMGLLFIMLNFNLSIGTCSIGLIPNFVGYYYLIEGATEMGYESSWFQKGKPLMQFMAVFSGIVYLMDLIALTSELGMAFYLIAIINAAASLYVAYLCIMGVFDLEQMYGRDFYGESLKQFWTVLVILNIIIYAIGLYSSLAAILGVVALVVDILFVLRFKETRDAYMQGKMF